MKNPTSDLEPVESVSLLGKHNGVLDDDLYDLMDSARDEEPDTKTYSTNT